jgi:hypothetical protein
MREWLRARCLAIDKGIWTALIEPQKPVVDDLEANATKAGRFAPATAVIDRDDCKPPPARNVESGRARLC